MTHRTVWGFAVAAAALCLGTSACGSTDSKVGKVAGPSRSGPCTDEGATEPAPDGCNTCTCTGTGAWVCTEMACSSDAGAIEGGGTPAACAADTDCSDFVFCNGAELCSPQHSCRAGTPLPDGTSCGQAKQCQSGACVDIRCANDADCSDFVFCNGAEVCSPEHSCRAGTPLPDGTSCGAAKQCQSGACVGMP